MKRILFALMAIAVLVASATGAAPAYSNVDAVPEFSRERTISSAAAFDTLIGSDSSTLVSLWNPDVGYQYVLVRDAITGDGADSVMMYIRVYCYDENNTLLYTVNVDTDSTSAGKAYDLAIGSQAFGMKYTLKAVGTTGNGGQNILNRLSIWKRRAVSIQKRW
jgi:hypothetical protein